MIYNVVLVSGVQQGDSVIQIRISILFQIIFPYRLFLSFFLVNALSVKNVFLGIPGSPVARTLHFHCRGRGQKK